MPDGSQLVIQFGLIPLLWSALVLLVLKSMIGRARVDVLEKLSLGAMLIIPTLGVLCLFLPSVQTIAPLPLPNWASEAMAHSNATTAPISVAGKQLQLIPAIIAALLSIYVVGFGWRTARFVNGLYQLSKIERSASSTKHANILSSTQNISAYATLSGKVVISHALLADLGEKETKLVIEHERAHIARCDPHWFLVLAALDCIFWFNPFIRSQTERCRLAAEIACDQAALEAAPEMRGVYARSLVSALKHTAGNALHCVPAAISKPSKGDYRMRMTEIMRPSSPLSKSVRMKLVAGLSLLLIPVGTVQMALAEGSAVASAFQMTFWPVEGKLSSDFGERIHPITKKPAFHKGVDWAAPKGTPVKSAASRLVVRAEFDEGYGNIIDVDHGQAVITRYSQLDSMAVKVGDRVSTGQKIGTVGASGRYATGPHLHFEVLEAGKQQDPASYFKG